MFCHLWSSGVVLCRAESCLNDPRGSLPAPDPPRPPALCPSPVPGAGGAFPGVPGVPGCAADAAWPRLQLPPSKPSNGSSGAAGRAGPGPWPRAGAAAPGSSPGRSRSASAVPRKRYGGATHPQIPALTGFALLSHHRAPGRAQTAPLSTFGWSEGGNSGVSGSTPALLQGFG